MEIRLLLKKSTKGRNIFRLRRPESVVGRAHGCSVRVPSADVSREHCRIVIEDAAVTVQDLGSLNGTLLNGTVIDGVQELHPGDFLRVGPALFEVQFDPQSFGKDSPKDDFVVLEDDEEVPEGSEIVLELADDEPVDEPVPLVEAEAPLSMPKVDAEPNELAPSWHIPEAASGELRDLLANLEEVPPAEEPTPEKPGPKEKAKKRKRKR